MVVIIASLFLPFQPQFEVQTSAFEAASLVESQPVKIQGGVPGQFESDAAGGYGGSSSLNRKRSSSSHSRSSVAPLDLAMSAAPGAEGSEGSPAPSGNYSQHRPDDVTKPVGANPQISSESFMESLTGNAHSAAAASSRSTLPNYPSGSVEEFFSSGPSQLPKNFENGTDSPDSTFSAQSSPLINSLNPGYDSTSSLLKNVNKSLLYQTVLNESNSASPLEGSSKPFRNSPGSTVITPRSRALPDVNSSCSPIGKPKSHLHIKSQAPAIRHVHPSAAPGQAGMSLTSGALAAVSGLNGPSKGPGGSSNLKYSVKADFDSETDGTEEVDDSESEGDREKENSNDIAVTEDVDDDLYDIEELDSSGRYHYNVPKFGGYSNNAKLRNALLRNSENIFSRAPWSIVPSAKGNGGLKNAVSTAVLEKTIKDQVTWVGTVGIPTDCIPQKTLDSIRKELSTNFHSKAVISDDLTFKGAYKNFCKQILWPTLHYQIPDNPNSKAFEDHSWNYYQHLNQLFANEIVETYKEGDIVWVNDYHLMLVPEMVREKLPNAKIGFFLHISFPSSEVFRCFPQRENILNGILGANSVGFQTEEYARHFMQTATRLLMTDADDHQLRLQGRIVKVNNTPIGIDVFNLDDQIANDKVTQWRKLIRERWANKHLIVCRDQFDRIRGLRKKMLAYERFLKENPEYIDEVVMIQICLDTARDVDLERDIMAVVDRINAMSKDISVSQPVVFLHQDLEFSQYLALNCEADLFIVSSMREGMNLTSHEFVVCSRERNAPLLLSEFTGSTQILKSGALLINPWDIRSYSNAIKQGLEMAPEEKRRRWKKMFKSVINHDSDNWIVNALNNIDSSWEFNLERSQIFNLSYDEMYSSFIKVNRRMFLLKISEPPSPIMLKVLSELSANNIVYIMNSNSRGVLERLYSRVSNVGLIAENGAYVRLNGNWFNIVEDVSWKEDVIKVFEDKVERLPGSYCKIGDSMVRFHTENAEDRNRVAGVVGEAMTHINTLFSDKGIHAYVHKNIVFVQEDGLGLKTLQFLVNYYNSVDDTSCSSHTPVHQPTSAETSASPLLSPLPSQSGAGFFHVASKRENRDPIGFLTITGSSSPVLEPLFQYVNELSKNGKIKSGYSVVYGDTSSTYAKDHIHGLNELFLLLQRLCSSNSIEE
ncbi:unnamed protein product [Kluyveromyces dobzhanskii CBS 2104]|uniref:WGS project CCBQ000000000 data, contig 00014 n=1 Tax=Kluyveromyces dobzhanskii CBS 2104 TaxID=1427455 RepID=A0A0A8L8Z5_9SACH|nr:unnamed protein product [Kluyveromyces dobzhanskii CBS 2104]